MYRAFSLVTMIQGIPSHTLCMYRDVHLCECWNDPLGVLIDGIPSHTLYMCEVSHWCEYMNVFSSVQPD